MLFDKNKMMTSQTALPGRLDPIPTAKTHFIFNHPLTLDNPTDTEIAIFGMGCFWGAERLFWQKAGVFSTMVGYGGGVTPNPTYQEVCTEKTGHNELVRVVFDPKKISYDALLAIFWENHDPTQLNRQGNDSGTQYRSGIYYSSAHQEKAAKASKKNYATRLKNAGFGTIVTEIVVLKQFYWAEEYHQQYLAKNPNGYCGIGGLGILSTEKRARA